MNMITDGLAWLKTELKAHAGTTIVIRRGELRSEPITAVPGQSTAEQYESEVHHSTQARRCAYLIDPADYVIADEAATPKETDRFDVYAESIDDWTEAAVPVESYTVRSPVRGVPLWRWTDGERSMMRVECLEV